MIKPPRTSAKKTVTLRAVAERAGTSIQTVSTVLNNSRSNTVVSNDTRARILAVAEEMKYRRNALARSLRGGYTNIIGFYTGHGSVSSTNPFIAEVFGGIQEGCNEYRKDLLIHGTFRGDSVDDIYDELTSGKIDGLVIFAPTDDYLVRRLQTAPLPVIALADAVPGIQSVVMDDKDAAGQAVRHLHELGHRHILYRHTISNFESSLRRLQGIQEEASRLGVRVTQVRTLTYLEEVTEYEKELFLSQAPDRVTAVISWCDASAQTLMQFLYDNRISVPDRIAVVGFDGFQLPYAGGARLTTLVAPWAEAGLRAVSLLVEEETDQDEILFPMRLRRGTTT